MGHAFEERTKGGSQNTADTAIATVVPTARWLSIRTTSFVALCAGLLSKQSTILGVSNQRKACYQPQKSVACCLSEFHFLPRPLFFTPLLHLVFDSIRGKNTHTSASRFPRVISFVTSPSTMAATDRDSMFSPKAAVQLGSTTFSANNEPRTPLTPLTAGSPSGRARWGNTANNGGYNSTNKSSTSPAPTSPVPAGQRRAADAWTVREGSAVDAQANGGGGTAMTGMTTPDVSLPGSPLMGGDPASPDHKPILAERFKTKMCRNYVEQGACPYEIRCMFAHGDDEMRTKAMNLADGLTTEENIKAFQRAQAERQRKAVKKSQKRQKGKEGGNGGAHSNVSSAANTPCGPQSTVSPGRGLNSGGLGAPCVPVPAAQLGPCSVPNSKHGHGHPNGSPVDPRHKSQMAEFEAEKEKARQQRSNKPEHIAVPSAGGGGGTSSPKLRTNPDWGPATPGGPAALEQTIARSTVRSPVEPAGAKGDDGSGTPGSAPRPTPGAVSNASSLFQPGIALLNLGPVSTTSNPPNSSASTTARKDNSEDDEGTELLGIISALRNTSGGNTATSA